MISIYVCGRLSSLRRLKSASRFTQKHSLPRLLLTNLATIVKTNILFVRSNVYRWSNTKGLRTDYRIE